GLRALKGVLELERMEHAFGIAIDHAQHGATAFIRIGSPRVRHHGAPRPVFDLDHSSSQKSSERYFSALSQRTVTIMPFSPRLTRSRATTAPASPVQPEEMPTRTPSSRARRRTMR